MNDIQHIRIDQLTPEVINYINDFSKKNNRRTNIIMKNTVSIKSDNIKTLDPDLVSFKILGGLDRPKYSDRRYSERVTYSLIEMHTIVQSMEKLEEGINPDWSELERAFYLYDKVTYNIEPAFDYKDRDYNETQSLRAIYSGGICAGYSLIYKELMDRQNIKCDYVRGTTPFGRDARHAWNVLEIDGNIIPVDCTWEAQFRKKDNKEFEFRQFGADRGFIKNHIPDPDERIQEYQVNDLNINKEPEILDDIDFPVYYRKDGSSFNLALLDQIDVNNKKLYKYVLHEKDTKIIYSELNVNELEDSDKYYFVNRLLTSERIDRYSREHKGYIGSLTNKDNKITALVDLSMSGALPDSKVHNRNDGTSFIMTPTNNIEYFRAGVNEYEYLEVINERGTIKYNKDNVYSETNIFNMDANVERSFNNSLMERNRVGMNIENSAGYIGTILRDGTYRKAKTPEKIDVIKEIKDYDAIGVQKLTYEELVNAQFQSMYYSQLEPQQMTRIR